MKRFFSIIIFMICAAMPLSSFAAADPAKGEREVFELFKGSIPNDRIKSPDDLYNRMQQTKPDGKFVIVDYCNSEEAFNNGHINGSILVVKPYEVPEKWHDPETEIWVVSRLPRSAVYITDMLYQYGYKTVYLVEGGLSGWIKRGYPLVNKYLGLVKVTRAGEYISNGE